MLPEGVVRNNHQQDINRHQPHADLDQVPRFKWPVVFFVKYQQCLGADRQGDTIVDTNQRNEDNCDRIQAEHLSENKQHGYKYDSPCRMACNIQV